MLDSILPNKVLTKEQQIIFSKIISFCKDNLVNHQNGLFQLNGDAGTGKSVILTQLFLKLEKSSQSTENVLKNTNNYFLVNHPELLKIYQDNAGQFSELRKNHFLRPTTFINQMNKLHKKADIVVIDEAHLLLSESDAYNNFNQKNQLEEIIKLSKVVIIVFDLRQVLKLKSYWSQKIIDNLIEKYTLNYQSETLKTQMRMKAPTEIIKWIDNLSNKMEILPVTKRTDNYIGGTFDDYDFRIDRKSVV